MIKIDRTITESPFRLISSKCSLLVADPDDVDGNEDCDDEEDEDDEEKRLRSQETR